ncbi:MAG: ABC transporter permease [Trueperaceae bacterium]|nr:ABC transporter permease [Trueperaceae bacterium]MCC6310293.1 ABC transporter permease [Trueperaceae bacterium]MCO5173293.1 ABC transporter permease [Trueperaceae bacterium]MCW5818742.1 ABC transporter permease [Trueperaceae bacterium]
MARFFLQRLVSLIAVLMGTAVLVFSMLHLTPGDPARVLLGNRPVSAQAYERLRADLGLDEPLLTQFGQFVARLARGDLGTSYFTKRPVTTEVASRFPITFGLMVGAMLVALLIGIPAGVISAARFGGTFDFVVMSLAMLGVSMPGFWVGLMLILTFSVNLGWLPVAGVGGVQYYVLPAIALGTGSAAVLARLTRSSMLDVLHTDYIRTARAKGLWPRRVLIAHAFKNAFIPVLTIIGLQVGGLLAGAVVIETVFALPGLGRLLVQGVSSRDYPLVQGVALIVAAIYVLVNFTVDLLYTFINPRIRYVS